jgi:outer membrane protein
MQFVRVLAAALLLGAACSAPALAENSDVSGVAGHFQFRFRGVAVIPEASGKVTAGGVAIPGSLSISDSVIPEVDATYFVTDHVAVEAIAGTTQHSPHFSTVGDLGSIWLLPPTVTAQYHFNPNGWIRPYLGAGVNYTLFYSPRSGAVPGMKYENSWGAALQAGADIPLGDGPLFLNVDVKQLLLNTGVKAAGGLVRAHANLNPLLVGVGIGIRL